MSTVLTAANHQQTIMSLAELSQTPQPRRIGSIDALRGINMFWLFGVNGAAAALAQMTSGKGPIVSGVGSFLAASSFTSPGRACTSTTSFFRCSFS